MRREVLLVLAFVVGCQRGKSSAPPGDGGNRPPPGWRAGVGGAGLFVETFDDVEWEVDALGEDDLFAVTCVGNRLGWAAGAGGAIWRTIDGGESFQPSASGTGADLLAIRFAHDVDLLGVVAGEGGMLAVSEDGEGWRRVTMDPAGALRGAAIAHSGGLIVVVGDEGVVLRSVDRGRSFATARVPGGPGLFGVAVDDFASLVLVAGEGGIWASRDGGATFVREVTTARPLRAVALAADGTRALAAGDGGLALARDGGGAWRMLALETSADLRAALISHDGTRDYLAGAAGTLFAGTGGSFGIVPLATGATIHGLEDLDQ